MNIILDKNQKVIKKKIKNYRLEALQAFKII